MSLSTKIILALILGIAAGLFFGESLGFLDVAATAFVQLLQMTVLPYVTVSLVAGLGSLDFRRAKMLAAKGGLLLLLFWGLTFGVIFLSPLAFPVWESASFFSTAMKEAQQEFNFLTYYIPANPFYSMANNIVPAVVLFSILFGVALIGMENKQKLLDVLIVMRGAFSKITNIVVSLTPLGIFAIAASMAGKMSPEELGRLQVYLVAYIATSLLLTFWIIPGLVTLFTPIRYWDVVGSTKDALITGFMIGNLMVILPMLIEKSKEILRKYKLGGEESESLVDVVIPTSFNFPSAGKLLMLLFVLFAGWFSGADVTVGEYPAFAGTGLLTMFGSVLVAVPFLLDVLEIPADLFQLFVALGFVHGRFATLLAAVHTLAFGLLGTCALSGLIAFSVRKLIRYAVITALLTIAAIGGSRILLSLTTSNEYTKDKVIAEMQMMLDTVPAKIYKEPPLPLPAGDLEKPRLQQIAERGYIRVGYHPDVLPYSFFNASGELVGFDVEMAHKLARTLDVRLELVPVKDMEPAKALNGEYCDIIMCGVVVTPELARETVFSKSYLDETIALLVKDHLRDEFKDREAVQAMAKPKIAIPDAPYYIAKLKEVLPQAEVIVVKSVKDFIDRNMEDVDACVTTAERGSAWSLLHPHYTVVVPKPDPLAVPVAYPVPEGCGDLLSFVNTFIDLKQKDKTIKELYDHWILGKTAQKRKPRWCILRDVLGWME